jgi:hypothetical protein
MLERENSRFPRHSLVSGNFETCFSYAIGSMFGSMFAHGFLIWKYSTHNLK